MGDILDAGHTVDENAIPVEQPHILPALMKQSMKATSVGMTLFKVNEVTRQILGGIIEHKRWHLHHTFSYKDVVAESLYQRNILLNLFFSNTIPDFKSSDAEGSAHTGELDLKGWASRSRDM